MGLGQGYLRFFLNTGGPAAGGAGIECFGN